MVKWRDGENFNYLPLNAPLINSISDLEMPVCRAIFSQWLTAVKTLSRMVFASLVVSLKYPAT